MDQLLWDDLNSVQLTADPGAVMDRQESEGRKDSTRNQVSTDAGDMVLTWLDGGEVNLHTADTRESYQERLSRLEGDKESLILQVSVLTDQVEAQGAKISDLENSVVEHRLKLCSTKEMLQQELLHRTSLEKQKLSLMGEVSYLKLKLADMEGKQVHMAERQHKAESVVNFISELQEQMCRFQKEINNKIQEQKATAEFPLAGSSADRPPGATEDDLSRSRATEEEHELEEAENESEESSHSSSDEEQQCKSESVLIKELRTLKEKVEYLEDQKLQYEKRLKATRVELSGLQQLLLCKNAEIESLHTQLLARPSLATENIEREAELQRLRTGMKALAAANDEKDRRIEELTLLLSQCRQFRELSHVTRDAPPAVRAQSCGRSNSSSSEEEDQSLMKNGDSASAKSEDVKSDTSSRSSSSQQASIQSTQKDSDSRSETQALSSSMNELTNGESHKSDSMSQTTPASSSLTESSSERSPDGSEDGDSNQTKSEKADDSPKVNTGQRAVGSPEYMKTNRSLKRLWGKLRRTQSGGLQAADPDAGQFRRGGLRATAGPRLTRTPESYAARDMNIPFSQWTKEQVCGWLDDYGLGQYVNLTRQWVENGQTLLSATPQDFEKEMGMRNPLHRKKLQLALRAFTTKVTEKSAELDHIWVTRWLDDIGLPQYKDQFHEARMDGRMIQYLTVNDLLTLKVTSQLHHLSIKCAIHVLHANKFNSNCLRRRPGEEKQPPPSEVVQWSNHRVMEWLRAVDLAEYAPNLRGSGVHGGLVILEPRFSAETLALLLNIPPQKTLLRRHLAMAFATLVGVQASQEKREYGNATGHVPLTTTAKVKPKKLGFTQFSHLRKRKPDESSDYICPIESDILTVNGVSRLPSPALRGLSPHLDRHTDPPAPTTKTPLTNRHGV